MFLEKRKELKEKNPKKQRESERRTIFVRTLTFFVRK